MDRVDHLPLIILLAGGQGSRLRNIFPHRPKALVEFGGSPFIHHLVTRLRREGAGRIILALGHGSEEIRECVEASEIRGIDFVTETVPRGTGGAIADIVNSRRIQSPFLIANADTWWEAPLNGFFESSIPAGRDGVLACVKSFGENRYTEFEDGLTFSGLAWLSPVIFSNIGTDRPRRLEDIWDPKRLECAALPGRFYDFGTESGLREFLAYFGAQSVREKWL
jgi:NDP-sugar pyrophosphorylase family protein